MQHPDITAACRDGYPSWKHGGVEDCPELRDEFIDDNAGLLLRWLRLSYPEILEEFIEMHATKYRAWLN